MELDKLCEELEARAKSDNSTTFLNYDRRKMLEAASAIRELQRDLRAKLTACEEERDSFLEFAKEQCSYCIGHPSGVFEHYADERIARYIRSRITDKMLLDGFIADRKALAARKGEK